MDKNLKMIVICLLDILLLIGAWFKGDNGVNRTVELTNLLADKCISLYKHSFALCVSDGIWDTSKCYDEIPDACDELSEYMNDPAWRR